MSPAGQPSILSFFHKQQPPKHAAPPSQSQAQPQQQKPPQTTTPPPPPQAPPIPQLPPTAQPTLPSLTALPAPIPSPHPSASILPVIESHIPALRRINALLLPVNYTDSFYKAILDPAVSGLFSRAILWRDPSSAPTEPAKVVGGLICRLEPSPFDASAGGRYDAELVRRAGSSAAPPRVGQGRALYIQSLVLLAPYRGLGLVTAALEGIFEAVGQLSRDCGGNGLRVDWVYAHVWTENEEGLGWYGRRGFQRDVVLEKYYWKLKPDSAWVVKRRVSFEDGAQGREDSNGVHELPAAVPASVTAAAVNLPGFAATGTAPSPAGNGPPQTTASRPPPPTSSLSFQNKRPDVEWNDLPEEMVTSKNSSRSDLLSPPSGSSSRSSSTGRKKKDRAYPTAAFGS